MSTHRNGRFNSLASSLRQNGMGWVAMMARIGAMVASMVLLTGDYIPWLPGLIYGAAPILSGVAAFFLPETLGSPLPDTIQDVEDRWERAPRGLWSDPWCKWVNNYVFLFFLFLHFLFRGSGRSSKNAAKEVKILKDTQATLLKLPA